MRFNADSLGIIKSFHDLEVLSLDFSLHFDEVWLSDATVFPPGLKRIVGYDVKISCSNFMAIVKHLNFLEEFDLGIFGNIFLDLNECKLVVVTSYIVKPCNVK